MILMISACATILARVSGMHGDAPPTNCSNVNKVMMMMRRRRRRIVKDIRILIASRTVTMMMMRMRRIVTDMRIIIASRTVMMMMMIMIMSIRVFQKNTYLRESKVQPTKWVIVQTI